MPVQLPLVRNSIPTQKLDKNTRLSVKAWNDYINVLKEQANGNTRYLETLTKDISYVSEVLGLVTGVSMPSIGTGVTKPELPEVPTITVPPAASTDDFLFTVTEPNQDYDNTTGYGKIIGEPFTL
jgi:hypothetical protein